MNEEIEISILGSTGSIGLNTISVIKASRAYSSIKFGALTGNNNIDQLVKVAKSLQPKFVASANPEKYKELKEKLSGTQIQVAAGKESIIEAASFKADWVMNAVVGAAGVLPSFKAIQNSKVLALANKETLVCAGKLFQKEVANSDCIVLPVDSEHSAIFQCLIGSKKDQIRKVILTASGGPFYDWSLDEMRNATVSEAIKHPKWAMGNRISIDSATMFNKALEIIEAQHLFELKPKQIEVLIHRQSIIHSMVEYTDNNVIAQMSEPDMRGAIGYAFNYPDRKINNSKKLDLTTVGNLTFAKPNYNKFPALKLAEEVMKRGGLFGAVLNAAKEIALNRFIDGEIGFLQMADLVKNTIDHSKITFANKKNIYSLDDVISIDRLARELASNAEIKI